jgi:hypothetical protein
MENQLDALHPSVTHQSTGVSARRIENRLKAEQGKAPLFFHYLSTFASSFDQWDSVQTVNFPLGHGILKGYMGLRPTDPDTLEHEAQLKAVPVGAVAAAAAALPAPARGRPDPVRDLALPPEGRARGDLPPLALVLQPGELAGDDDQRR